MSVTNRLRRLGVPLLLVGFATLQGASADDSGEGFRVSQTCAGCHGTAGAAPGNTIPILGGQRANYLARSLKAYKSGDRDFYVMNYIAKGFTDAQIGEIADWFEAQPWVSTTTPADATRGESAKRTADSQCAICHGRDGGGSATGPRIGGQPVAYLDLALQAYKQGARGGTAAASKGIVIQMSDDEIDALAHFYSSMR